MATSGGRGGRPKGTKNSPDSPRQRRAQQKLREKEEAREHVRALIDPHFEALVMAQVSQAKGIKYLVVRQKSTGKFLRVSEAMARKRAETPLGPDEEEVEIWEKDPSTPAFIELMNRALDKSKEQKQEVEITGSAQVIEALQAARKRLAEQR